MSRYRWIGHGPERLENVGVDPDGVLHNPNGYPEDVVRQAVHAADIREREARSQAARKAAATRARRQATKVYGTARRIVDGNVLGPRAKCSICARKLDDAHSTERGVGPECWDQVLDALETLRVPV